MSAGILTGGKLRGYWGAPTSTLDWCEENYVITDYICEFWNTTSNFIIVAAGVFGLWQCRTQSLSMRFYAGYLLLLLVGVGSWAFHQTLLFEMQLLDELPMLYGSALVFYCTFHTAFGARERLFRAIMILYSMAITAAYIYVNIPIIQHIAFGLPASIAAAKMMTELDKSRPNTRSLLSSGSRAIVFGFALWNVDNLFCGQLRDIRQAILDCALLGPLSGVLTLPLQLHAVWHLMSGWGSYLILLYIAAQSKPKHITVHVDRYCFGLIPALRCVEEPRSPREKAELHHKEAIAATLVSAPIRKVR